MADLLWDVIWPDLRDSNSASSTADETTLHYLDRLSTLSLSALTNTEPEALTHDATSLQRSIQALSKRSATSICTSDTSLSNLSTHVPAVISNASTLQSTIPALENAGSRFAKKYSKHAENAALDRRKRLMRLGDNVDRLSDMLELPTLLSSVIASAAVPASTSTTTSTTSYATALDLHAHIKRLGRLYPHSALVTVVTSQGERAMKELTTNLVAALRSQSLKLAGAMRLVGLLRRVAPDMDELGSAVGGGPGTMAKPWSSTISSVAAGAGEGALGSLFLVCRLSNLLSMLDALGPLRDLADQETESRLERGTAARSWESKSTTKASTRERDAWAAGQQTERYLKRYIEVFREQCFASVSMYKSVFPSSLPNPPSFSAPDTAAHFAPTSGSGAEMTDSHVPAALATYIPHITSLLLDALRTYLPNVRDQSGRESLLTQVLYCSASLGRLGGEFGMLLAFLEEEMSEGEEDAGEEAEGEDGDHQAEQEEDEPGWIHIMKKHRVQAGRLEMLSSGSGVGGARVVSREIPPAAS